MPPFQPPKYTDAQRAAVAHAAVDRGLKPANISRLAAAGELEWNDARLEPFDMPAASVGTYARRLKDSRAGRDTGDVAQLPPRDAVELLRKRLVQVADRESRALARVKAGTVDAEKLRQLARAVREIAALPGPADPRPAAPGARVNGEQQGAQTQGGLAGPLLRDHRATHGRGKAGTAPTPSTHPREDRDTETPEPTSAAPTSNEPTTDQHDDGSPGSVVRALADHLRTGGDG